MSTSDLASPAAQPETDKLTEWKREEAERLERERAERERAEARPEARVVAGPDARRVAQDDAGAPMTPPPPEAARAAARTETRADVPPKKQTTDDEEVSALFADDACQTLWKRWDDIQAGFVDEPRRAVQDADSLVAETMQQLANTFARERNNLEGQWGRGDNVSTEDLRIAFRRYRSFFKRLLSV